jgi:nitroreductase
MSDSILSKTPEIKYSEEAAKTDFQAFKVVVNSRRSVRVFNSDQIPDSVVEECLDLALLAPFSSNLQTWEFYWVKNPEKKAQLAKACMDQNAAKTASALIVCVARTDNFRKHAKMMVEKLKAEKADKMLLNYYDKLVPFVYSQGPFGIFAPFKWLLFFLWG